MPGIKFNFINQSSDNNNSSILIFMKGEGLPVGSIVAWTVIQNCGYGWRHPFAVSFPVSLGVRDAWGNYSPLVVAESGSLFSVQLESSGTSLTRSSSVEGPAIGVQNSLASGDVVANVYNDGRLLATCSVASGCIAHFNFMPTIWIRVVSQIKQGDVLNEAFLSEGVTELSLLGLASADIVMKDSEPGAETAGFVFYLENVVYA